jgi:hypothetical protein
MVRARAVLLLALLPALAGLLVTGLASARPADPASAGLRAVAVDVTTAGAAAGSAAGLAPAPRTAVPRLAGDLVHARATRAASWPGSRIRYWAGLPDGYDWSLRAGVAAWNSTGLDLRFVRTTKARAQLRITVGDTDGHDGLATVGHQRDNWVHLRSGLVKPMVESMPRAYARVVAAHVIAHELGHVLGLRHSSGCRLMTADLRLPTCRMMAPEPGRYDCRVVDGHTLDLALTRYGGRRTLAPSACPLDPLPPRLRGVSFAGGLAADAPVSLGWARPDAPPGSRVVALVSSGPLCRFPVTLDYWGQASYDESQIETVVSRDPSREGWVPPSYGDIHTRCYALQLVNRTGAGRPMEERLLQGWVAAPAMPTVGAVRPLRPTYAGSPGYLAAVAPPPADADPDQVAVLVASQGACPTAWPADEDPADHLVDVADDGTVEVATPDLVARPCLAFFAVRPDRLRVSDPVAVETSEIAAPGQPQVAIPPNAPPGPWPVSVSEDPRVVEVAYLVAPSGQCVTAWPDGELPDDHLVADGEPLDPGAEATPCFTLWAVDGFGRMSSLATVLDTGQVPVGLVTVP